MAKPFVQEILRGIHHARTRFWAVVAIVALGCGFFAGLLSAGPDMRKAADQYFDTTALWDIRLISDAGLSSADIERISRIEGIDALMPSTSFDVLARKGQDQYAVRVERLGDFDATKDEQEPKTINISELNRTQLIDGRWPQAQGECVVAANAQKFKLAPGDTIDLEPSAQQLKNFINLTQLKVVGTIRSPEYPYTGSFGSTSIGSGTIEQYIFVTDASLVQDAPYTEVFATVKDARRSLSGSQAYQDCVDELKERLEQQLPSLEGERLDDLKADAQATLNEKNAEYQQKYDETFGELDKAAQRLDAAAEQISEGTQQLSDGKKSYESGVHELERSKLDAQQQLSDAEIQLEAAQEELSLKKEQWQQGCNQLLLALQKDSLEQAQVDVQQQLKDLDEAIIQIEEQIELIEQQQDEQVPIPAESAVADETDERLAQLEASHEAPLKAPGEAPLAQLEAQLQVLQSSKEKLQTSLQSIEALRAGQIELQERERRLAESRQQLLAHRQESEQAFDLAKQQLKNAKEEIEKNQQTLADAQAEYQKIRSLYEERYAEALDRFGQAWSEIQDAQTKIDRLEEPEFYVLDRTQNEGIASYQADSERLDNIARVFPLMFFLVAALVALTTMTRMVEDDRALIGTLKALGYSKTMIANRYLAYTALASGLGAVLGIAVLSQVLPYIIMSSYSVIYDVPILALPLPLDAITVLISGGLGIAITLVATLAAVMSELHETPAALMLPRAPKAGKRILLEKIGFIWSRLSFSWKVSFRNLFRYKRRFFMTIVGVAGCTALLLVGLGLRDAISDIIDKQYGELIGYDVRVTLKDSANELDAAALSDDIKQSAASTFMARTQTTPMHARGTAEQSDAATDTTRVLLVVPQDTQDFSQLVMLRDRQSKTRHDLGDDSVVISEKLALLYKLQPGDELILFDQDELGNPHGEGQSFIIDAVCENYVDNYVYMGKSAWERGFGTQEHSFGTQASFSTFYLDVNKNSAQYQQLVDTLKTADSVSTISFTDDIVARYSSMLSVVNLVVLVLIVSAAALVFIVLYNLTNINIEERTREIASLRVLGFTRKEVQSYIFREVLILALLGDLLGLVLGAWLERFVITTAEVDYLMFGRSIHGISFVIAFALTLIFSVIVLVLMRHKIANINMVESLKSVD